MPTHAAESPAARPNVLFILADDLGWGDLGCYGNRRIRTPSVDKLAHEGILFTQYYQGGAVCSPARCTLLSGRWPAELKVHDYFARPELNRQRAMDDFMDPKATMLLPHLLRQSGYKTVHIGKWHLGTPPGTSRDINALSSYGFDETRWLDYQETVDGKSINLAAIPHRPVSTRTLVDETIKVLESVGDQPFYCQLWLVDPHAPLAPSPEQMKPYRDRQGNNVPAGFTAPFDVYAATVTEMDFQIGRLMQRLEELNLAKNTIVIFSSDNGPEDIEINNATWSGVGSAGPLRGRKRSIYDGGVRVPFIVRWHAGTPAGKVNDNTVVSGADLLPTICELTGTKIPDEVQSNLRGQSVVPAIKGSKDFFRSKPLFWEFRVAVFNHPWNRPPILAIRDGKWKLLVNPDGSRTELYDMLDDPGEQNNLADRHPAIANRLSETVRQWQKTLPTGPTPPGAGKNNYPWPRE